MNDKNSAKQSGMNRMLKFFARLVWSLIIPAAIVTGGVLFYQHQMATKPKAQRQKPPKEARLVAVEAVTRSDATAVISAMGTVVPAQAVMVSPEVTGVITKIDPAVVPGSIIEKGQLLYQLDVRDYETVVTQRQSELALAELNLKQELANQTVAKQEYSLLDEVVEEADKELILREPHLARMQAALTAARSALEKAKLDVERCRVVAPFNAIIHEKFQDVGARVSPSNPLVSITGIDEYWVEVSVPVDQLQWIDIPAPDNGAGSAVKVYDSAAWGAGQYKEGNVIRLLSQLEEKGRMARLLVSVKDPLCLENGNSKLPLLIDSYVRVAILGVKLSDVVALNESYLHDGDNVWLMQKGQLHIQPIDVFFRSRDTVFIKAGLDAGQQVITTDISAPVEGMAVRLEGQPMPGKNAAGDGSKDKPVDGAADKSKKARGR